MRAGNRWWEDFPTARPYFVSFVLFVVKEETTKDPKEYKVRLAVGDASNRGYDSGMQPKTLADELEREPFIPLRLRLSDGRTLDILNPGLCYIARLALYVFRVGQGHSALAEDVQVISLRHIVSVETQELSPPT